MFYLYQGFFRMIQGLLMFATGYLVVSLGKRHNNSALRYFGWAAIIIAFAYSIEIVSFFVVPYNLRFSSFLTNLGSQFGLHFGLSIGLVPVFKLKFRQFSIKWATLPLITGLIASILSIWHFRVAEISGIGMINWHRYGLSEYITMMTTIGTSILIGYTLISSVLIQQATSIWDAVFISLGVGLIALTSPVVLFTDSVVLFWILNWVTVLGGILLVVTFYKLKIKSQDSS